MTIKERRARLSSDKGMALSYMAVTLTVMLLFTGLAVDGGRGYVVKAQLTKAVDGAALGAARSLNSGDPRAEAVRIFKANFPPGYIGTNPTPDPTAAPDFFDLRTDVENGINYVTINAQAVLPTTFMKLGSFQQMTVRSTGEAARRMVDLSLILDVSGSIGSRWPAVRDAAREFIRVFDEVNDRMSLVTYSYGARVLRQMPATRGFDKTAMINAVPNTLPGGVTNMSEGLYRGWDEMRTVPLGQQSALRVIVLFTDGSANTVSGIYDATGVAKGLFVSDFPRRSPDPDGITTDNPAIQGLYHTETGVRSPSVSRTVSYTSLSTITAPTNGPISIPFLPPVASYQHHRSGGIQATFPLMDNTVMVDGATQVVRRGLQNPVGANYPAHAGNIRRAATNLIEIVGQAARQDDTGDYPIRIYTIGMGNLVRLLLGTRPEMSEDVLKRIANDVSSPDYNEDDLEGKYYYARTEADLSSVFQQLQNQIIRLTR
jgi:Flp pilus assembly protein TadG